jgi:chemotaxis protein methyltransferase CheR
VIAAVADGEWKLLADLLERRFGFASDEARRPVLEGHLRARARELRLASLAEYYHFLRFDADAPAELALLRRLLTNNETYFFREAYHLGILTRHVVPGLDRPKEEPLRILSAGCSSGEEVYSIVVTLQNAGFELGGRSWQVEGCDLNPARIAQARNAVYEHGSLRACDAATRARLFVAEGQRWALRGRHKLGTRFFEANLAEPGSGWAWGPYDAIFCRNVLIYFSPRAFHEAISLFARCLPPGGWLFLGHSESLIDRRADFEPCLVDGSVVYRKVAA